MEPDVGTILKTLINGTASGQSTLRGMGFGGACEAGAEPAAYRDVLAAAPKPHPREGALPALTPNK